MNRLKIALAVLTAILLGGCGGGGGGGGGGSASLIGRVLSVTTGGPTSPGSSIQGTSGSPATTSDLSDGSFTLTPVGNGTTQFKVVPSTVGWPVFTFNIPPASGNTVVGDLWIGPEQVVVHGRVLSSTDNQPISNATVSFGGQTGKTNASGVFDLSGVGYSSDTQTAFWGIVGTASATNFFKSDFNASPNIAVAGVVDVGDILLTPANDTTPPDPPYNITGRVLPIGGSAGCVVTLKQGGTPVRIYNVNSTGKYFFWVNPGNYTITYVKGGQSAPDQTANLTQPNQTITVPDVSLN